MRRHAAPARRSTGIATMTSNGPLPYPRPNHRAQHPCPRNLNRWSRPPGPMPARRRRGTPTAPTPLIGATIFAGAPAGGSTRGRSPTPNASAFISRRSPPAKRAPAAGRARSPPSSGGSRRSPGISRSGPCPSTARTATSQPCSPASAAPMAGRRSRRRRCCPSTSSPCWTPCPLRISETSATGRSCSSASPGASAARKSSASS